LQHDQYDVIIIGAGIVGTLISYNLSKYRLKIACVEKESEVATGASGNNSGVIHSGINLKPGSKKAKFCVEGNRLMYDICEKFHIPYRIGGTLVLALSDADMQVLDELKERAELNGVDDVKLVSQQEIRKMEPHVKAIAGLFSPRGGITDPKMVCRALADAAKSNGVDFLFNAKVSHIEKNTNYKIQLPNGQRLSSTIVINSAGLYSDEIANLVGFTKYKIHPWLGEYYIIDRSKGYLLNSMVYPAPHFGGGGLGIHLTKSLDGRIFVGPNAVYLKSKEERVRTPVEEFYNSIVQFLPEVEIKDMHYGHVGVRTKLNGPETKAELDFVIEEYPSNFLNIMGIESPGFTAAPALAEYVCEEIGKMIDLKPK